MKRTPSPRKQDAIALLKADHAKVKAMFKEFSKLHDAGSEREAVALAAQICDELRIHSAIEEEIFYPEVREAIDDADLMDEAEVEHTSAKELIFHIESDADKFAANVIVLGEYINHHVEEEQGEMFPKAKKSGLDLKEMADRMLVRKEELKKEMGIEEEAQAFRNSMDGGSHASA